MSTEAIDPRYVDIDQWPTTLAVEAMLEGQMAAIAAIVADLRGSTAPAVRYDPRASGVRETGNPAEDPHPRSRNPRKRPRR